MAWQSGMIAGPGLLARQAADIPRHRLASWHHLRTDDSRPVRRRSNDYAPGGFGPGFEDFDWAAAIEAELGYKLGRALGNAVAEYRTRRRVGKKPLRPALWVWEILRRLDLQLVEYGYQDCCSGRGHPGDMLPILFVALAAKHAAADACDLSQAFCYATGRSRY